MTDTNKYPSLKEGNGYLGYGLSFMWGAFSKPPVNDQNNEFTNGSNEGIVFGVGGDLFYSLVLNDWLLLRTIVEGGAVPEPQVNKYTGRMIEEEDCHTIGPDDVEHLQCRTVTNKEIQTIRGSRNYVGGIVAPLFLPVHTNGFYIATGPALGAGAYLEAESNPAGPYLDFRGYLNIGHIVGDENFFSVLIELSGFGGGQYEFGKNVGAIFGGKFLMSFKIH
ncbi:MAG: hypothetical protein HQM16_02295 [Deltaproteobacteria bacterium]|nr:hypothetical protein [Deltaproteobacteria bacterium]